MKNEYKRKFIEIISKISLQNEATNYEKRGVSVAAVAISLEDENEFYGEVNSKSETWGNAASHAEHKLISRLDKNKQWLIVTTTSPCNACEELIKSQSNIKDYEWIINNSHNREFDELKTFDLSIATKQQIEIIKWFLQRFVSHQNRFKRTKQNVVKLNWDETKRRFSTKLVTNNI